MTANLGIGKTEETNHIVIQHWSDITADSKTKE